MHLSGTFAASRRQLLRCTLLGLLPGRVRADPASGTTPALSGRRASLALDLASGRVVAAHAADLPLVPASTAKLATAVAALDLLGDGYRFETVLLAAGTVAAGVLEGDLVLRGNGEPLLDLDHLLGLALAARRAGLRSVAGRFLYDESAFPVVPRLSADEPEWEPWNAGVGPLGVAFDRVSVHEDDGGPYTVPPLGIELRRVPAADLPTEGIRRVTDADGRTVAWLFADDRPLPRALPVDRPGRHTAEVFRHLAAGVGLRLPPPQPGRAVAGAAVLARRVGAPLRELVRAMLHYSNNQVAERIGLAAAVAALGRPPRDRAEAVRAVWAHLRRTVVEFAQPGTRLVDLCGLDAGNRLTARQLAALLRHGWTRQDLAALLPLAGWSGTLYRRLVGRGTVLAVAAKTGSLDYASALAGYVLAAGRSPLAVALLADDPRARTALRAQRPASDELERAARAWRPAARLREERFVEGLLAGRRDGPPTLSRP